MSTQRIRMLSTRLGSPDGIETRRYLGGETYDLPPSLAAVFLHEGWAESVIGRPAFAKPACNPKPSADEPASAGEGRKDAGPAPRNKALAGAPQTRAAGRRLRAQHRGFGRWYLVDRAGAKVSGPYKSRAAAEAARDALIAERLG